MRDKLFISLYDSCRHRVAALSDATHLSNTIIGKLGSESQDGLIASASIARMTYEALSRFDAAAASHYQAFHKDVLN
jgi:transcriptional regulator NrdR family protein